MATDKNKHLDSVLQSHKMKHEQTLMDKYIKKRDEVKEALDKKYSDKKCSSPINSGSYAKHTAINTKFDIDLCIPFKFKSFKTCEAMADDIFDYFDKEYKDSEIIKEKTRKQRVSTGLTFLIDNDEIKMDVVPGRELTDSDYAETKRLNLYVRAKGNKQATTTQTNIQKHIDHISGKGDERKIIRLLKVWKVSRKPDLKSFFIELITIRAFDENSGKAAVEIWDKLKMVLEYIRDNVENIKLLDPANSNNIVSDTLSQQEKKELADDMHRMLKRIDDDSDNIKMYFPENDKYTEDDEEGKGKTPVLEVKSFG